jgi:hypothetical protein
MRSAISWFLHQKLRGICRRNVYGWVNEGWIGARFIWEVLSRGHYMTAVTGNGGELWISEGQVMLKEK